MRWSYRMARLSAAVSIVRSPLTTPVLTLRWSLYVTLEPCSMCAGLIVHSRIQRVVYGATEPKAGVAVSRGEFFSQHFLNHRVLIEGGVSAEACSQVLSEFFKGRRLKTQGGEAAQGSLEG